MKQTINGKCIVAVMQTEAFSDDNLDWLQRTFRLTFCLATLAQTLFELIHPPEYCPREVASDVISSEVEVCDFRTSGSVAM